MPLSSILLAIFLVLGSQVDARTKAGELYSYFDQETKSKHSELNLRKTKFGIFWGPCGPAFGSVVWSFDLDLEGEGPEYSWDKIKIKPWSNGIPPVLAGGVVKVDIKKRKITVQLKTLQHGLETAFVGNGTHKFSDD